MSYDFIDKLDINIGDIETYYTWFVCNHCIALVTIYGEEKVRCVYFYLDKKRI